MLLKEAILAIALTFPAPWHPPGTNPESPVEYQTRLDTIAEAIAEESKLGRAIPEGEHAVAAATLVLWHAESSFELAVHTNVGKTRWGQDKGRARCLGQLHATGLVPKPEWEILAGADLAATRRCASATMRMLRAQYSVCRHRRGSGGNIARMYEAYATGRNCEPSQRSTNRAAQWKKVSARLWALTHEPSTKPTSPNDAPPGAPNDSPPRVGANGVAASQRRQLA